MINENFITLMKKVAKKSFLKFIVNDMTFLM